MRNRKYIMALLAMDVMGLGMHSNKVPHDEPEYKPAKKPIPAGCKEFTYFGHTVYALNEARAIKKCKKLAGRDN